MLQADVACGGSRLPSHAAPRHPFLCLAHGLWRDMVCVAGHGLCGGTWSVWRDNEDSARARVLPCVRRTHGRPRRARPERFAVGCATVRLKATAPQVSLSAVRLQAQCTWACNFSSWCKAYVFSGTDDNGSCKLYECDRQEGAHDDLTQALQTWLSPWEITSRAELGAELQLGYGEETIHSPAAMFYPDQVATVESSIATLAMTQVRTGKIDYSGAELDLTAAYMLNRTLENKIQSKFVSLRAVLYGFLSAHDGFFVRREGDPTYIMHDAPPAQWATPARPMKNWRAHPPKHRLALLLQVLKEKHAQ